MLITRINKQGMDVTISWLCLKHAQFFRLAFWTCKVGHNELTFGVLSGFINTSVHTQDYKSLCAAVTICSTLVNIQTHTSTHRAFWRAELKWDACYNYATEGNQWSRMSWWVPRRVSVGQS